MRRTDLETGGISHEQFVMTPELRDYLVREAHRARNEAIGLAISGLAHAIGTRLRRALRVMRVVVLRAGQHANAALGHAEPPGRRC